MQRRNILIFVIIICVSGHVNPSFSFPGDFNFNGNIQKVNYLYFNSYFTGTGQLLVPNPDDHNFHNSTEIPKSFVPNTNDHSSTEIPKSFVSIPNDKKPTVIPNSFVPNPYDQNSTDTPESLVPIPNDHNSTEIPKSSAVASSGRGDRDDDSDAHREVGDIAVRDETEVPAVTGGIPVTDEEQLILYSGLPVDYSFNETLAVGDDPNKQISAPGCPASGGEYDYDTILLSYRSIWVHHGNPPRCYLVGSPGPCGKRMRLGLQRNTYVGKCKCTCFVEYTKLAYLKILHKPVFRNLDPYLDEKQNFCFDYDKGHFAFYQGKCHMLLTQGPCKNNEAFALNNITNKPSCEVKVCPESDTDGYQSLKFGYAIKHNGTCSKINKECLNYTSTRVNKNDGLNHTYYVVGTKVDNPMPSCISPSESVEFGWSPLSLESSKCADIELRLRRRCTTFDDLSRSRGIFLHASKCEDINQHYSKSLRKCILFNSVGRSLNVG